MKQAVYIFSLLLISVAPSWGKTAPRAFAHRYHTSVTRLEYNAEDRLVEITVQTFADDVEAVLTRRTGSRVRLDGSKQTNALVFDYLRTVFQLNSGDKAGELQWVGMELKGNTAWIYVQIKMAEGLAKGMSGASLRNTFLFDLFDDQVNIVNILKNKKTVSLVFKRGDTTQLIP